MSNKKLFFKNNMKSIYKYLKMILQIGTFLSWKKYFYLILAIDKSDLMR